jgi:hypothetical protein
VTYTYLVYAVKELQGTDFLVAHATSKKTLQFFVPECLNQFFEIERAKALHINLKNIGDCVRSRHARFEPRFLAQFL